MTCILTSLQSCLITLHMSCERPYIGERSNSSVHQLPEPQLPMPLNKPRTPNLQRCLIEQPPSCRDRMVVARNAFSLGSTGLLDPATLSLPFQVERWSYFTSLLFLAVSLALPLSPVRPFGIAAYSLPPQAAETFDIHQLSSAQHLGSAFQIPWAQIQNALLTLAVVLS
jgi:hypothetical protein